MEQNESKYACCVCGEDMTEAVLRECLNEINSPLYVPRAGVNVAVTCSKGHTCKYPCMTRSRGGFNVPK